VSDYITLMGAEEVSRAGHNMQSAASDMRLSVSNLSEVLQQQQRFMDDWLQRLEAVLAKEPNP
jgi:hypothetical protein